MSTFSLHVEPKLRGSSDIRWKSTANESELMQQQQDCKADGSGRRLAGRQQKWEDDDFGQLGRDEVGKDRNGGNVGGEKVQ